MGRTERRKKVKERGSGGDNGENGTKIVKVEEGKVRRWM